MSSLAGIALLGIALGITRVNRRGSLGSDDDEFLRQEFDRRREIDRKARRQEDRIRRDWDKGRESRYVEIRRISAERGVTTEELDPRRIRPQYRSKAELRMPIEVTARADVQKYTAELRKAINKKRVSYARSMLRKLENAVSKLNPEKDGPMIDLTERLIKVARSRGIG